MRAKEWFWTNLTALFFGAVGGALSWCVFERYAPRPLRVVDDNGLDRVAVFAHGAGNVTLGFLDRKGRSRLLLGLDENGLPVLGFVDEDGKTRMALSLGEDGSPVLGLVDEGKNLRLRLNLPEGLTFWDEHEKLRASMLFPDQERLEYSFTLFNETGSVVWTAPRLREAQPTSRGKHSDAAESQPASDSAAAPGVTKDDS